MSIAQISPSAVQSHHEISSQVTNNKREAPAQSNNTANQSVQAAKSDTVTISKEAVHKLQASDPATPQKTKSSKLPAPSNIVSVMV
jgi:hypothetical protein